MGMPDDGGGPGGGGRWPGTARTGAAGVGRLTDLIADPGRADVHVTLVARQAAAVRRRPRLPGYTLNGTSPGPEIRARVGPAGRRCALINESVPGGRHPALARGRRAERATDGVAGRHPGRGAGRRSVRLPLPRRPRRDLLVPLAPGVATSRCAAGCSARSWSSRRAATAGGSTSTASVHTLRRRRTINGHARRPAGSTPRRAAPCGCG